MRAVDMQRPTSSRETQDQTTGAVFVGRIILEGLGISQRLLHLIGCDLTQNRLVDCMPRKLEPSFIDTNRNLGT
jgi:hypothetical protein